MRVDMTTCRMTRTSQISSAAALAARAASRTSGSPGLEFAASFKQTQSPAQGLAPRNTPSRTTPTLSRRQLPSQLYNFSTVSLPTAHISSSQHIRTMTTDFKQQPHKLLVIPGPIEFSDTGTFRSKEKQSETFLDERRARRGGESVQKWCVAPQLLSPSSVAASRALAPALGCYPALHAVEQAKQRCIAIFRPLSSPEDQQPDSSLTWLR